MGMDVVGEAAAYLLLVAAVEPGEIPGQHVLYGGAVQQVAGVVGHRRFSTDQSSLITVDFDNLRTRAISAWMNAANAAGVPATTSAPSLARRSLTSGRFRARAMSVLSVAMTAGGVPPRARIPYQVV